MAVTVTLLWSSSYVLVKIGLVGMRPLTLVALRYTVASLVLLPLAFVRGELAAVGERGLLTRMFLLGLAGYTVAQGLQCVGLSYLPAVTVTFINNFTPVVVLLLGVVALIEYPTRLQIGGILLVLSGAYLFFNDPFSGINPTGILITLVSGLGWAFYLVFSRLLLTMGEIGPLGTTAVTMSLGTVVLDVAALMCEGLPSITGEGWMIILWLGLLNTAVAFFLWNIALQSLEAFEISILQNTMLIQIAVLAWIFLGERLTTTKLVPMALVFMGALVVQLKR